MTFTELVGILIGTIGALFAARVLVGSLRGAAARMLAAQGLIAAGFLGFGTVLVLGHGQIRFAWPLAPIALVVAAVGIAMIAAAARGRVHS